MNIISTDYGRFILSNDSKPCAICGSKTNKIEIHFESRICSDKCCITMTKEYTKSTNK